ncbi:GH92 family glycosyl hydrolase [Gammaproteobacteria bacterium]|nr:GH92 family glycosyl hydrolase [Gammaproteobacteria bacterium]
MISEKPIDVVNPFIGVDGPGNTLCGPYTPFGLVRLGPDCLPPHPTNGYRSDRPLQGFTHTHVSGTGGEGRFGNLRVVPYLGAPDDIPEGFERSEEIAAVGLYGVCMSPGNIWVELTSTPRCGICRFSFPEGNEANILIDAGAVHQFHPLRTATCLYAEIQWISNSAFEGHGTFRGGWGHDCPYKIFFSGSLNTTPDRILVGDADALLEHNHAVGEKAMAVAHFRRTQSVEVRIGVSFVGIPKARDSHDKECQPFSFEELTDRHRTQWQSWFDRIQVEGGTEEQRQIFQTFFYRLLCMPTDLGVADEMNHWQSDIRHFSEFYCLWDSVRNANSLLMLFAPELQRDMLNCLLDVADKTGWLPDAWITGHSTKIQGGSSADILFNEAALKGITGIDYASALSFMRKNNEVESEDPYSHGRYLADYRDLGFVSTNAINCVSRHLEYSYQDWCIGSLAEQVGQHVVAERYFESARKLWNLWRPDLLHFAPKTPDGDWAEPFDINYARPDSWNDPYFYEGVSRAWSFNTQHDFAELVERCGGASAFEQKLDDFFNDKLRATKETFMHIPLLYHYAYRPDKSSLTLRNILAKAYSTARNGLPDNEDMGCHSAFYMCGMLGLYPMMGQDWYFLTAPGFTSSTITLGESGATFVIKAPKASPDHIYISAAKLNGKPIDRAWVYHREIEKGGQLTLDLCTAPTSWGAKRQPPSPMG